MGHFGEGGWAQLLEKYRGQRGLGALRHNPELRARVKHAEYIYIYIYIFLEGQLETRSKIKTTVV